MARFIDEPDAGVLALVMEFAATALNPTQGLIKGQRLLTLLRDSPGTTAVLTAYDTQLAVLPWAIYDVRRTLSPRKDGKVNHARSVRLLDVGDRGELHARLRYRARVAGVPLTIGDTAFADDVHARAWLRRREPEVLTKGMPTAERFLVVAPATAQNKTGPAFPTAWDAASQLPLAF